MSTPLGSEPAFPLQVTSALTGWTLANHGGLSKREWLAGMAMQGILANESWRRGLFEVCRDHGIHVNDGVGDSARQFADGLLRALKRVPAPTHTEATPEPPNAR